MAQRKKENGLENTDDKSGAKRHQHNKGEDSDEEDKDSEEDDAEKFITAPDGVSIYIVQGYTDNMAGMDILYKWRVKSIHKRF
jgi:hypothetical protein